MIKIITLRRSNNQYNRQQLSLQHVGPTNLCEMCPKFLSRHDHVIFHPFFYPFNTKYLLLIVMSLSCPLFKQYVRRTFHSSMAGEDGFEPTNARVKVWCLTAWRHPNTDTNYIVNITTKRIFIPLYRQYYQGK